MNHITRKKLCVSARRVYGTRRLRSERPRSPPGPAASRLRDVGRVSQPSWLYVRKLRRQAGKFLALGSVLRSSMDWI